MFRMALSWLAAASNTTDQRLFINLGAVKCTMVIEGRLTPHDIASKRTATPCHESPETDETSDSSSPIQFGIE